MIDPDQDLGCQEFTPNTDHKFETFEVKSYIKKTKVLVSKAEIVRISKLA
jgi:hypothetical protein